METAFKFVYAVLVVLSEITGLSYKEINVVTYFFVIPAVLLFLVDRITRKHFGLAGLVAGWIVLLIAVPSFSHFADALFDASVVFLKSFGVIGLNYVAASVVICVILAVIVFFALLRAAYPNLFRRRRSRAA